MIVVPAWEQKDQICTLGKNQWSVSRLIELSKDLKPFPALLKALNIYTNYNITLLQMCTHFEAVRKADLSFPIILDEDGELMDGRHRIMKAILLKKDYVLAVRFDENPRPCRMTE